MLGAYFFSRLSDVSLWPYTEQFGARVGLGVAMVGVILAASVAVGVFAPLVALRVRGEQGVLALFASALAAKAFAPALMMLFATQAMFICVQFIVLFALILAGQLFLTHFSSINATGRLAAIGSTLGVAADAVGLGISGQSFAFGSYRGVAVSAGVLGFIALVLCMLSLAQRFRKTPVALVKARL